MSAPWLVAPCSTAAKRHYSILRSRWYKIKLNLTSTGAPRSTKVPLETFSEYSDTKNVKAR